MTTIIAELGINWNSDFELLKKLADSAMKAGFDYVKLQLRTPRICVPESQWHKPRQWFDGTVIDYIEYKERMELTDEQLLAFDEYMCITYGYHKWSASVWDTPSLERLLLFDVPFVKLPSAMLTNYELIAAIRNTGKPVIISTGMSTEFEVVAAVKQFPESYPLTILACTSTYPCPDEEAELLRVETLKQMFPNHKVGYSMHTPSPLPGVYAAVLGAEAIEAHVTLDRSMQGSDHGASLELPGASLLVREIRRLPALMGTGAIKPFESEKSKRESLRG